MADEEKPSMEETMGAVFDRIAGEEKAARDTARAEVAEPVEAPAPAEAAPEPKDDRVRDEEGKFAKAPKAKAEPKGQPQAKAPATGTPPVDGKAASPAPVASPATPKAPQTGPAAPPSPEATAQATPVAPGIQPPAGWSAAAKAAWKDMPPVLQAAVARREQEVSEGFQRYEGIGRALAPMNQLLQQRGVAPAAYISQMVQIDQALSNPATRSQAFDYLARTYGYNPQAATDPNAAGRQPAALSQDPTVAALQQQLALVTGHLNQQEAQRTQEIQAIQAQTQRQAFSEVDAFRNDPANEFFDFVRDDVRGIYERAAALNQPAPDLKTAYEQAIWANPQTRPILLARELQKTTDAQAKATAEAAAKARKSAAPNVRGAVGVSSASAGPRKSIEEEMAETYDRINAA